MAAGTLPRHNLIGLWLFLASITLLALIVNLPTLVRDTTVHVEGYHRVMLAAKDYLATNIDASAFVAVQDGRLWWRGRPFVFAGFNNYFMMTRAADKYTRGADVVPVFDAAAALNLTVMRTWAFADGHEEWNALQPRLGQLDERVFREGMDWVLAEARSRGLLVLLVLTNYDPAYGGAEWYVRQAGGRSICDFYTSPRVKGLFKDFVAALLLRRNHWTGVQYKDDPTILGWELANEPLCPGDDSGDVLHSWIEDIAAFVKALDSNHLVSVGVHGYYGASTPHKWHFNPSYGGWLAQQPLPYDAVCEGADFVRNGALPQVDLLNLHVWADNWLQCDHECKLRWTRDWVVQHIDDAQMLGKPVVFGEVGALLQGRTSILDAVFGPVEAAAQAGKPVAGTLLWMLGSPEYGNYDGYTLSLSNATWARPPFPPPTSYMKQAGERSELRNWAAMMECITRRGVGIGPGLEQQQVEARLQGEWEGSVGRLQKHAALFMDARQMQRGEHVGEGL